MSRWVGACKCYAPSKVGKLCPWRSDGTKISVECKSFREDCGLYEGTVHRGYSNTGGGYTQAEWERKVNMC